MGTQIIRNGTLIDGNGEQPIDAGAVLVADGRIAAVGREGSFAIPGDATEIDAGGGTILPGMIDAHVHLFMEGLDLQTTLTSPFSLHFYRAIDHMRRTLDAGITSVRDAGGIDLGVKTAVERGLVAGPRIQLSLSSPTTTGGHVDGWMLSGNTFEVFPAHPGNPGGLCDGPNEARRKVRQLLRAGADVIKVCATGGVSSPTDHPDFVQFSPEELAIMVQEGRYRNGVRVMAHAEGAEGIKNAVRAGVHSIEHGFILDDEAIELMLDRGTFLVPTLSVLPGVLASADGPAPAPDYALVKAREYGSEHRDSIARAQRAGVRIAMGTDAAAIPHGTNLQELGLMCECGMTPMEALVATTGAGAECLGWEDRVGTLEAGKLADVVIARTDPLADIRSLEQTSNIALVMKGGEVVKDIREA